MATPVEPSLPRRSVPPPAAPLRLGLLLYPGCMPAGLFAAADMARAAGLRVQRPVVQTLWVGADLQPVPTWQGPALAPTAALAGADVDAVLVPGLWLSSTNGLAAQLQQLAPVVRALAALPRRTQVWSYCAGVLLAAASGRLRGRGATATWWLRAALEQQFGAVRWRFDEPLVQDGAATTAAGANGHLPLMLHALGARIAPEALADLQALLMLPRPRATHPAFAGHDLMATADADLRRAMLWVQRSPAAKLRLPALADALGVSPRTLARRVQAHTGLPAAHWMRRIKLRQVSEALCDTPRPLKRIAEDLGFASEAGLHRAFRQATGQTPLAYRMAHGRG
ncbi:MULTISPECIES: helix-turn-helix domain-containing protein [unclassified Acidovorax]|uniref:helix-turn-helix domain-containing protein n=1 Tax=unclassified Acidovorax TaxID=2684926 RepID=UPI001C492C82|nr:MULTISPECIES: helix-turn-helix domain-containing protein [unclassified Acidovorax]MBV7429596.1 helix-turn-helix domain-containing protein [Acidovorax sp. sif0732]MBV7448674.1 helix-turn-helix domain-containing protein [Acidovorax sp. sif0715]